MPHYPEPRFDLRQYNFSDDHPDLVVEDVPEDVVTKLSFCHAMLILPIWDYMGQHPLITSAYRNPDLNKAVGGSSDSQHIYGEAVDFKLPLAAGTMDYLKAVQFIKDQLYYQTGFCYVWVDVKNERFRHIHWSLPLPPSRGSRLNDRKFWYKYDGTYHTGLPIDAYKWSCSTTK
jgi:hypothetical protein